MQSPNKPKPGPPLYTLGTQHIVFEDDAIIVINKPSGWPSQGTVDKRRDHLFAAVERYVALKTKHPYVGLHHRLDSPTSGLIVMTKKRDANKGLAEQISGHRIQKTYLAVCKLLKELPPKNWNVQNHLKKISDRPARMGSTRSGGDFAETEFTLLKHADSFLLIQAMPKTGRMHQIRVHLSEAHLPILGDPIYRGKSEKVGDSPAVASGKSNSKRLMLHAWKLQLLHPMTKKPLEFEAPVPPEFESYF